MTRKDQAPERLHRSDPRVEGSRLFSGELSAGILHRSDVAIIAEGEDGSLWVLVQDKRQRPRRDPGVVVQLGEVHYEPNGLVRICNRRVATESLERLVYELTGTRISIGSDLGQRSRIPEGDYAGISVQHVDAHYRVRATGVAAKFMQDMQPLGPHRWLVVSGEESRLRRQLVDALMPLHHRVIWLAVRHGEKLLMAAGILLALLSFVTAFAAPLALAAAVGLAVFRIRQRRIVAWTHRAVVKPHILKTFESKHTAPAGQSADQPLRDAA